MKTLYRLVVSAKPITDDLIDRQTQADGIMRIPDQLNIVTEFAYIPNMLDGAVLESDKDIDEKWLKAAVNRLDYHWIHLHMDDDQWRDLGLRNTLWGQQRTVGGQVVSYGRWSEDGRYQTSHRYESPVSELPEEALGVWHEGCHGFNGILGASSIALTHSMFYGYDRLYTKAEEKKLKPRRYVKTPTPLLAWRSLQWGRLPELETRKAKPVKAYGIEIEQKLLDNGSASPQWWTGNSPKSLVLHTTRGDDAGLGSWAWLDQIELSYHFIIASDGKIYQLVPFGCSAWHAGIYSNPTAAVEAFFNGENPNRLSIGIAFARNAQARLTDDQVVAFVGLAKIIGQHTGVHYSAANIFSHIDISDHKPAEVRDYRWQCLDALQGDREPDPVAPPEPDPVIIDTATLFAAIDTEALLMLAKLMLQEAARRGQLQS